MKILGKKRKQAIPEPRSRKWAGGFTIQGRWTKHGSIQSTDHSLSGDILFGLGGNLDMASPENEGEGYDGTGSGTENWKPSREAESFYITFDDEGLAEVTWINPCIVEENEGGGVFLLPFSDILQVFQKSITKQYILEMLSGNGH